MQNKNLIILRSVFFLILIVVYPLYANNIEEKNHKIKPNINTRNTYNLDSQIIETLKYSSFLIASGEEDKDFTYIIDFTNEIIEKYGEDSEYTLLAYLALTRHYIAFNEFENANALFAFINEIKENKKYENNLTLKIIILHLKSNIYLKNKKYKKAYDLLSEAIEISEKIEVDASFRLSLINSFTQVLIRLNKFKKAHIFARKALTLYKKTDKDLQDKESFIQAFINYGELYENQNNYLFAYETMNTGFAILSKEKILYPSLSIISVNFFINYAIYAYANKKYEDTIFASDMALKIEKKLKIKHNSQQTYMIELRAKAYEKLGESKSKNQSLSNG